MDEYESVAKFYKDNTSFIEEMEEKEGQELEIAISEAKKFLVKYGLKPQQYGKCKFNNLQTRTEGVYHNGDWRKTNFILVKVFRNKIYCWFDAVKIPDARPHYSSRVAGKRFRRIDLPDARCLC